MTTAILARASLQYDGASAIMSALIDHLASSHTHVVTPIGQIPSLTLTPSQLACRFCGISKSCNARAT
jgi:ABC-type uncharacterized transport system permease subunit